MKIDKDTCLKHVFDVRATQTTGDAAGAIKCVMQGSVYWVN